MLDHGRRRDGGQDYFLGLPWQHTRGSSLLASSKEDAAWLAERIEAAARLQRGLV